MDGFEKINLEDSSKELNASKFSSDPEAKKNRHLSIIVLGAIAIIVLFFIVGILFPGIRIANQARITISQARLIASAAKSQNVAQASIELGKTKTDMDSLRSLLKGVGYISFVPFVNMYYSDAVHVVQAGEYGLDAVKIVIDSVNPYADVLGLHGQGSFTGGTAEQRIQTAVQTFAKVVPGIDKISGNITSARKELDMVNENHYPNFLIGNTIRKNILAIKTISSQASLFTAQAGPLIKILPSLLGEPAEQKYLILFQNDKELRPTGGFITAYAVLRFDHGVPSPDKSDDIYTLDGTIPNKPSAPRLISQYLPKVPQFNLRDSNISPDFITSMDTFNKMYVTASGYTKVNGIISIDTYPLVDVINVLGGSIQVDGQQFSTKIDPACKCANVIYQLEANADQPVGYVRQNRKGIVGDLMLALMKKALSSSPKLYWNQLFQVLIGDISQKHVLFDIFNGDAQNGIEAVNAAGRIKDFNGDYLHINESNFGGAKSNMYIQEDVAQNYQISPDGIITKTITINYRNPYPPSDCNLERGGLCLNAILRDVVRVYVPKGSQLISSRGSEVKLNTYDELGKTVYEGFLTVPPLGIAKYTLTYTLPFKLASSSILPALYQKQPGTDKIQYTILLNNHQIDQFPLIADKQINIKP